MARDNHAHDYSTGEESLDEGTDESGYSESPELSALTIGAIEAAVRQVTPATDRDTLLLWLDRTANLMGRIRGIRSELESRAVEWITANGDLIIGDIRYTSGHRTTTHCINVRLGIDALLRAVGGEPLALESYLKADPFKYGSCKSALSSTDFNRIFRVESKVILRNGVPTRQLRRVNDQFRFCQNQEHR